MARQALGKGLGALIPAHLQDLTPAERASVTEVAVAEISPNPYQPRARFEAAKLKELADSIAQNGMLQPVILARRKEGGYVIVAGERRLRAAQSLGYARVPAVIRDAATAEQLAEWALVENLQRDDLNPMEEARAYQRLTVELGLTQEQVAQKVGKDRASVANALRLLRLPEEVQRMVEEGRLSMGHARALLAVESPQAIKALALAAEREGWSVRQTEKAAAEKSPAARRRAGRSAAVRSPEILELEERLKRSLGTKVRIAPRGKAGVIEIHYYSDEELERLLEALARS